MKVTLINHPKGEKPNIPLTVRRVEASVFSSLGFHKNHYMSERINPSCKCLLFEWKGIPVAFVGVLNAPSLNNRYKMSVSRIVILPQYQGFGLFKPIINFVGGIIKSLGEEYRLYIKTAHTLASISLNHNNLWVGTPHDGKCIKEKVEPRGKYKNRVLRKSTCKKYIGDKIEGYEELLLPVKIMRERARQN